MNLLSFPGVFLLVDWGISQNSAIKNGSLGAEMFSRARSKVQSVLYSVISVAWKSQKTLSRISLGVNCSDKQLCRAPDDPEKFVFLQDEVPVDIPHVCVCILWAVQCRGLETPPQVSPSLHVPEGEHCTHSISSSPGLWAVAQPSQGSGYCL